MSVCAKSVWLKKGVIWTIIHFEARKTGLSTYAVLVRGQKTYEPKMFFGLTITRIQFFVSTISNSFVNLANHSDALKTSYLSDFRLKIGIFIQILDLPCCQLSQLQTHHL